MEKKHLLFSLAFASAVSANAQGIDLTKAITNANCDNSAGWTTTKKNNGSNGPMLSGGVNGKSFEYWENNASNRGFDYNQSVELEPGKYTLSARVGYSVNGVAGVEPGKKDVVLYAAVEGGETKMTEVASTTSSAIDYAKNNVTSVEFLVTKKTKVTIGVKNQQDMTARWVVMDDFTLTLDYAFDAEQCSFELQKAISVIGGYDKTKKDYLDKAAELQSDITKLGQKDYDTYLEYIESYNKLDEAIKAKIADLAAKARTAEANAVLLEIWAAYEKFTSAKSNAQTLINTYKYDKAVYQARLNAVQYAESNLTKYGSKDGVVADGGEDIVDAWKDIVAAIEAQTEKIALITADGDAAQEAQGSADEKAVASVNSAISALNTAADALQSNINKATIDGVIDGVCGTFSTDPIKAEIASVFVVKNEIGAATDWYESKVNTEKAKIQAKITKMQDELDKAIANHEAYTEVKKAYDAAIATYNTAVAAITESINSDHFAEDKTVAQGELRTQRTNLNTALAALNKAHEGGTMVAEQEAITNSINAAKAVLEASKKNWTELVASYKAAYDAKNATIAALSYDENADKDVADFTRVKNAKAAIPAAISAMQEKLDGVKGKAAVLTLDLTADVEAANTLISTYTTAIADAKAAVEANKAALEDIAAIEKAINDQKTATSALQSEDKAFTVGTKCDAEFTDLTNNKTAANTALATAFAAEKAGTKPVGSTATQQASVASLKSDVNTKLADINQRAADAVAKYNELQAEVAGYQARLAELKKAVEGLNIYEATGYNYKGQIEALNARVAAEAQKLTKAIAIARINDWKENVGGTVVTRRGVLYNLNAITIDAKITGDIKTLEDSYEPAEAGYKAHVAYESCKTMYDEAKARIDAYQANEMADFAEKHKPVDDEVGIAAAALNSQYEAIVEMVKKLSANDLNPVPEGTDGSLAANTEKIAQLSTVRDEINKVEEAVTALDNAVAAAKQALADNVAKKAAAEASISTLNSTLDAVKSNNYSTVTGYYADQKTAISTAIATLTSDIAASNKAQSLVNDYKDVKDKDGKVTKKGFETRISELTDAIAALKADVDKADSYYAQIYPTTGTTVTKAYNDLTEDVNYVEEKGLLATDLADVNAKVDAAKTALETNAKAGTVVKNQSAITSAIRTAKGAISSLQDKAADVRKNHVAHDAIAAALKALNTNAESVESACGASYTNADKWRDVVEAAKKYAADNNPGEFKVDDKCYAAQSGINTAVAEHTANLKKVADAASDNAANKATLLEKYNDMDAAWYTEYEAIKTAFADQPAVLADAKTDFEALQSDMFDISAEIEKAYKAGLLTDKYEQGVSKVGTIEGKISANKQAITDIRKQYNGTYSVAIAKVNADNKAAIQAEIDAAKKAYTEAINTLNALKDVKNAAWAADIKAAVEAANATLYPIALDIRANESDLNGVTLEANEYLLGSADAKVEDSKWYLNAAASLNTVKGAIEKLLNETNLKAADAFAAAYTTAYDLLDAAKAKVAGYIDVTDAFKDVENLLAEQKDKFDKAESESQCVVYDEIAEALDADKVQDMLDADLQKAAKAEYDAWIQTYDKANTGIYQKYQAKVTEVKVGSYSAQAIADLKEVYDNYIVVANKKAQQPGLVEALPVIKENIANNFESELYAIVEKAQKDYAQALADEANKEATKSIETAKNNAQAAIDGLPYNPDMVSEDDAALIEAAIQAQQEKLDGLTYPADQAEKNETRIKNACTEIINAVNGVRGKDGKYTGGIKQQIEAAEKDFIANNLEAQIALYLATEYKTLVDKYNQIAADFTVDVKVVDAYDKEIKAMKAAIEGAESIEALKALNDDIVDLNARMDGTIHADEIASMHETLNSTVADLEVAAQISIEGIEANIYADGVTTYEDALAELNEGIAALKADVAAAGDKLYYFNDEYTQTADELAEKAESLAAAAAKAIANETAWASIDSAIQKFIDETIPAAEADVEENCPDVKVSFAALEDDVQDYYNEMNGIYGQGGLTATSVDDVNEALGEFQAILDNKVAGAKASQKAIDNADAMEAMQKEFLAAVESLNNAMAPIEDYDVDAFEDVYEKSAEIFDELTELSDEVTAYENPADEKESFDEKLAAIVGEIEQLAADVLEAEKNYLANTYQKGDVSHDGKITAADYSTVLSLALGEEVDGVEEGSAAWKAADINEDDEIDIADVVGVVNLWKGLDADGGSAKVKKIKSMMKDTSKDGISIMNLGNGMFAVSLDNVNEYVGFQLDIQMPEGLQIVESNLAERAANHNVATSMLADGTLRVIVSSTDNMVLEGNSGNIVIFRAESDGTFGGGEIVVSGKFADSNAYAHVLGAAAAAGDEATGIAANNIVVRSMYKIYNAGGVLVDKLQKGINILVGEDGSSKKVMVK